MAKISDKIAQLQLNDYYVVAQETDLTGTPVVYGKKISLGRFNGKGIKEHYVKLYRSATEDSVKPSVSIHVYQDNSRSETGLVIRSTTQTYWFLAPTENFDQVYPEAVGEAASDSEFSTDFVPSKGYVILWNNHDQKWDTFGFNEQDTLVLVGRHQQIKAVDVDLTNMDFGKYGLDTAKTPQKYWHSSIITSPDGDIIVEGGVDISNGEYEGQPIKMAERVVFTPLGSVFAFDTIQTSH
jgi:hypothetical protein